MARKDMGAENWRLCDRKEIAKRLGISVKHLQNLTQQGTIPYYRLGRSVRYDPSEVWRALQFLKREGSAGSSSPISTFS